MTNQPPRNVANAVKDLVFTKADVFGYLSKTRTQNGEFLDRLVADSEVGSVLAGYMNRAEVRTYIKDAILNRYSKVKTKAARPQDYSSCIFSKFGFSVSAVDSDHDSSVFLYRSNSKIDEFIYVVVAEGTLLKWETALRKALIYLPGKPFSENKLSKVFILLSVFAQNRFVTSTEKVFLDKSLSQCNAKIHVYGEGVSV